MPFLSKAFQQGLLPFLLLQLLLLPSITLATCHTETITATTDHLIDNNNGTVSDPRTGLMWKKCSEGQSYNSGTNSCDGVEGDFTWQTALQQAQAVNVGDAGESLGQTDWNIPNINELASILELSCSNPAINEAVFPATSSSYYWSSSTIANDSNSAWVVHFGSGVESIYNNKSNNHFVRLVRSE